MARRTVGGFAAPLAALALAAGCTLPHGSIARPVSPVKQGTLVVGAGASLPFGFAGTARGGEESVSFSTITDGFSIIPGGSFDMAVADGTTLGATVSYLQGLGPTGARAIFVNPRFEVPLGGGEDRKVTFNVDGRLGYFDDGKNNLLYFSPTVGLTLYLPLISGGLILNQNIGTGFITITAPGGVGYDIAIGPVHVVPELRWDPTFFGAGDYSGSITFLTGGLAVLLEI